jgi:cytochrome c-type biogenesis protein CcmE
MSIIHPVRQRRLLLILALVAGIGVAVGLTLYALQQNINLFFSPSQIAAGEAPPDRTIRVGGLVVAGSVQRDPQSLQVSFDLTDNEERITVYYTGILPDLFREGQGIIARGSMGDGNAVMAEEVLAKHDENYMPPEIADTMKQAHANAKSGNATVAQE